MKILLFAVGIIAIFLAIVIRGYVFMFFWNSFVVPAFGVNEFGFVICAGLSSFFSYLLFNSKDEEKEKTDEETLRAILRGIFRFVFISGFTLVVGLILKAMI